MRVSLTALLLAVSFPTHAQEGYAGHGHDNWHHGFYERLQRPDAKGSCCNLSDCRPTSGRMLDGRYEVKVDGAWISVPPTKIIRKSAPDGGRLRAAQLPGATGRAVLRHPGAGGLTNELIRYRRRTDAMRALPTAALHPGHSGGVAARQTRPALLLGGLHGEGRAGRIPAHEEVRFLWRSSRPYHPSILSDVLLLRSSSEILPPPSYGGDPGQNSSPRPPLIAEIWRARQRHAVALGQPHQAALVAEQPLVDVVELLN
jgi:hypothetical protein